MSFKMDQRMGNFCKETNEERIHLVDQMIVLLMPMDILRYVRWNIKHWNWFENRRILFIWCESKRFSLRNKWFFSLFEIVQRRHQSLMISNPNRTRKCILTKSNKDEKFGLIVDCQYYIKKLPSTIHSSLTNLHEGNEILQVGIRIWFTSERFNWFRSMIFPLIVWH